MLGVGHSLGLLDVPGRRLRFAHSPSDLEPRQLQPHFFVLLAEHVRVRMVLVERCMLDGLPGQPANLSGNQVDHALNCWWPPLAAASFQSSRATPSSQFVDIPGGTVAAAPRFLNTRGSTAPSDGGKESCPFPAAELLVFARRAALRERVLSPFPDSVSRVRPASQAP